MNNNYGTVTFEGKKYNLLREACATNKGTDGDICYHAPAERDGIDYIVTWDTTEAFNDSDELSYLETMLNQGDELTMEEMERYEYLSIHSDSLFCTDESNACDWDSPVSVELD